MTVSVPGGDSGDGMKRGTHRCSAAWVAFTCVGVGVALAAGGCGGSGGASRTATAAAAERAETAPSRGNVPPPQFVARAEAICSRVNKALEKAPANPAIVQVVRVGSHNAALERSAVAELGKLRPPASLARDWGRIVGYRRALAGELVKLARYAQTGDVRGLSAVAASKGRLHKELSQLATREGLNDCARVGAARSEAPSLLSPLPVRPARTATKL